MREALVDDVSQPFDFASGEVVMPVRAGTDVEDGTPVEIALSGLLDGDALRVANRVTVRVLELGGDEGVEV